MRKLILDGREIYEIDYVENDCNPNYTTVIIHLTDGNWMEVSKHNYKNKERLVLHSLQVLKSTIRLNRYWHY